MHSIHNNNLHEAEKIKGKVSHRGIEVFIPLFFLFTHFFFRSLSYYP